MSDPDTQANGAIYAQFKADYLRGTAPTAASCHRRSVRFARERGLTAPSCASLMRRLKKDVDPKVIVKSRGVVAKSRHFKHLPENEPRLHQASAPARDVMFERDRQINACQRTPQMDDGLFGGELVLMAISYALASIGQASRAKFDFWPYPAKALKSGEARDDLVRAGALILAEIERIDRENARIRSGA